MKALNLARLVELWVRARKHRDDTMDECKCFACLILRGAGE